MIRRGFWLTAGAVTGIYGYRRVSAVGRRLSASLTPGARVTPGASLTPGTSVKPRVRLGSHGSVAPGQADLPLHPRRTGGHGALYGLRIPRPQALPSQQTTRCQQTTTLNPRMATDGVGRDRPPLPCVLRAAGARDRAFGLLGRRRPHGAVRHRGHAAVQAVPARPADAAVPASGRRAEVRADAGHRRGRQDHQARHVLPDAGELVVRRLLQAGRHQVRLGAAHQVRGRRRVRVPRGQAVGHHPAR